VTGEVDEEEEVTDILDCENGGMSIGEKEWG